MVNMQTSIADVSAALAAFVDAKIASTGLLTKLVDVYNTGGTRLQQQAALTTYIQKYNELTSLSNSLRDKVKASSELAAAMIISLENLSDDQVEEMKVNPQQYFCAGYLALVNSLLFYGRETGLSIADMVHGDLVNDINNAYDDFESGVTPQTPPTAILFSNGHALELVEKAIKDATPVDPLTQ